jgi:hypothetical protein
MDLLSQDVCPWVGHVQQGAVAPGDHTGVTTTGDKFDGESVKLGQLGIHVSRIVARCCHSDLH